MKKMGKRATGIMVAAAFMMSAVAGCSGGEETGVAQTGDTGETKYISIATSSSGGAFSIIGTAMADIINKNVPGVSANIEITGGSSENILLAENGNVELAMTASDVLALALNGEGSFEGKQVPEGELMGVMGGHLTTLQVYVLKDGPIQSYADLKGKKVVCLLSGGNIDVNILSRVITRGLVMTGRNSTLTLQLEDKPGQLKDVSEIISRCGGNVVRVHYNQSDANMAITSCYLTVSMETRDKAQVEEIKRELSKAGFQLISNQ